MPEKIEPPKIQENTKEKFEETENAPEEEGSVNNDDEENEKFTNENEETQKDKERLLNLIKEF